MRKTRYVAAASVAVLALLASCASGTTPAGQGTDGATGQASQAPRTEPAQEITIGYTYPTKNNEFWGNALAQIEIAAQQLGVKILSDDANNKQEEQIADVQNMFASGIQGLVLAPQDASVVPGILSEARAKDIPVVIVDRYPGDELVAGTDYVGFIGPNDVAAGKAIANSIIASGATKLVALGGFDGTSVAEGRKQGLMEAIEANPGVELLQYLAVGENMDDGTEGMTNLLQAHPDLDGVWGYNDSLALASVDVLKAKGKIPAVKVGGMDLLSPAIESMQAKELWFSTGGHYMQSAFGLVWVYDAINGKPPAQTNVQIDTLDIDQNSVGQFVEKYIDNPAPVDYTAYSQVENPGGTQEFTELTLN